MVAPIGATLLPQATIKAVLIPTKITLPIGDKRTQVKVVNHLVAKYTAQRTIMLTAATNDMFDLILLMLTLLDMNSTTDSLHVSKGPITRSKAKKIQ